MISFGSGLSVRNYARFGSALASSTVNFGTTNSSIRYTSGSRNAIEFSVDNFRSLSLTPTGGVLHGTWSSDSAVGSSDRRLKRSIVPLYKALAGAAHKAGARAKGPPALERASTVGWVLRQLRPVSFKFKSGPEGKYSRYGFVAQELQQVLPAVVRGQGEEHLSVVYQDLIALLTLAAQVLQDKVNQQEESISTMMKYIKALDEKIDGIVTKQEQGATAQDGTATLLKHMRELEEKLDRALSQQKHSNSTKDSEVDADVDRAQGPRAVPVQV